MGNNFSEEASFTNQKKGWHEGPKRVYFETGSHFSLMNFIRIG